jgi:hypothetical protein
VFPPSEQKGFSGLSGAFEGIEVWVRFESEPVSLVFRADQVTRVEISPVVRVLVG